MSPEITRLLAEWRRGEAGAFERLVPLVYEELRHLASRHLNGERADHTLQTTALAHEAYLRLAGLDSMNWDGRRHFFAMASRQMRRILVDYARRRRADKRGGDHAPLSLDRVAEIGVVENPDFIRLHAALEALSLRDSRAAAVVEMRFFGGLKIEEVAELMSVSPATIRRDWTMARAWLLRELDRGAGDGAT